MSPSPLPALGAPVGATPHRAPESAQTVAPDPEFDALVAQHAHAEPKGPDRPKAPAHPKAPHRAGAATKPGGPDKHDRPADQDQSGALDRQDDSAGHRAPTQQVPATIGQLAGAAGATAAQPSASGNATVSTTPASDATTRSAAGTVAASGTAPISASAAAGGGAAGQVRGPDREPPTAARGGVTTSQAPGLDPKTGATSKELSSRGHPPSGTATAKNGAGDATARRARGGSGPSAPGAAPVAAPRSSSDVPHDRAAQRGEAPASGGPGNATTSAPLPTAGISTGAAQQANAGAGTASTGQAISQPAVGGSIPAQVQPTVARLVSRGDGTHRMSLQLHPAELGEVRVTVTVKNGSVSVSLAAAPAAQDALRDGSAQLRSLLSSSGHSLDRLVVQDLPAATTVSGQPGTGQAGVGQQGPQHWSNPAPAQGQQTVHGQAFGSPGQQSGQQSGQQFGQQGPGDDWSGRHPANQHPASSGPVEAPHRTLNPSSAARGGRSGLDLRI